MKESLNFLKNRHFDFYFDIETLQTLNKRQNTGRKSLNKEENLSEAAQRSNSPTFKRLINF